MTTFTNAGGADDGIQGSTASHDKNGVFGHNDDTTARNAATPAGNGVFGFTQVPDGAGVFGLHNSNGVGVVGFGHPAGIGVVGMSVPPGAKGGDGVLGVSNSEHRNGTVGRNDSTTPRGAADAGGNGVFGFTQVPDGAGVFGAHATAGVGVAGLGFIGISGGSVNGVGVMGVSAPAGAKGGDGVQGITNSEQRNGVYGRNDSTSSRGNDNPAGNGVFGFTQVPDGAGVMGAHGSGGHGVIGSGGMGVIGTGTVIGVWGQAKGAGWAGYFSGPVKVEGKCSLVDIEVTGTLRGSLAVERDLTVSGDVFLKQRDMAERFDLAPAADCVPGMVMVACDDGTVVPCSRAYDKRVLGVVSGAGTLRPAITLGAQDRGAPSAAIALVGTAYCLVDATHAAVEVGDLLTTSETRGHAMKATEAGRIPGTVIGKALGSARNGCALVPILVAVQ